MRTLFFVLLIATLGAGCDASTKTPELPKASELPTPPNPINLAKDAVNKQIKVREDNVNGAIERSTGESSEVNEPADGIYRKKDWAGQKDWAGPKP